VAPASFGLNVARLAGIPDAVLRSAGTVSRKLEHEALLSEFLHCVTENTINLNSNHTNDNDKTENIVPS
jgi:DNA mismatch repair ATPase MutS